jgi:isopentenyl-diphosphate Delta-isomerase
LKDRKKEHIELALKSQLQMSEIDDRFFYEPMLSAHPDDSDEEFQFLGKSFKVPIWVSSMTGGTGIARSVNENLARVCNEFGLGMGLGSCRTLLDGNAHFNDFDLRDIIGEERAFYANLGISQIEQLLASNSVEQINDMVSRLRADGLIIHVNPLQEWIQPEGDRIVFPPFESIERILAKVKFPVIVKEVGQGIGPESLKKLLQLPLMAIEFAAFGGTNFSRLELLRAENSSDINANEPFSKIGMDANSMVEIINKYVESGKNTLCKQLIISGGIKTFLDGYYFLQKSKLPAIYGQASSFLTFAKEGYEPLYKYVESQINGLRMAKAYLRIKE